MPIVDEVLDYLTNELNIEITEIKLRTDKIYPDIEINLLVLYR
jgi:hypothetical protein